MPKLTIIIPVYNGEEYISRCLNSVFSLPLSAEELEVIAVDDCSTDGTLDILTQYQQVHSNLVILRQEKNMRQGAARNRGIAIAKGEYIAFADADDEIISEGIVNALNAMRESGVDVCYFDYEYEYPQNIWNIGVMPKDCKNTIMPMTIYLNDYYNCGWNAAWRTLYRTNFLKATRELFLEGVRWEDCDWTVKVYSKAKEIQFVDGVGYRYAFNQNSTSCQNNPQAVSERIYAGYRLRKFAEEIQDTHLGLAHTLQQEAKGHYACEHLNRIVLTTRSPSYLKEIYQLVDTSIWEYLKKYKWPKWVYMVIHYHKLTLLIVFILHFINVKRK